jgi:hypothetical protein
MDADHRRGDADGIRGQQTTGYGPQHGGAEMETKTYAVLIDTGYYADDCQHPNGWELDVAMIPGEDTPAMGTLAEVARWMEEIDAEPTCLPHGAASCVTRIAEVVDDRADYQGWIDNVDSWDGCPSPDGDDDDANTAWAEDQAYQSNGTIPVSVDWQYDPILVDLSSTGDKR